MDERISNRKQQDGARQDRAMNDRSVTENREVTDSDRVAMFRQKLFQSALPDLPEIPGYHVCWLTTQNPRDSIAARVRLGYEPIKSADIPGYEITSQTSGEMAGLISVNEMVAYKIPMDLYQAYMRISHHEEPLKEEGKLADTAKFIAEQARAQGADVVEGDGIAELRKGVKGPMAF